LEASLNETTLYDVLDFLGYDFNTHSEPIYVIKVKELVDSEIRVPHLLGYYRLLKHARYFDGHANIRRPEMKEQLNNLYFSLILPTRLSFNTFFEDILEIHINDASGIMKALKEYIKSYYMSVARNLPEFASASKMDLKKFGKLIDKMFESVFVDKLKHTLDIYAEKGRNGMDYVRDLIQESIEYALLHFFMSKISAGQKIDIRDLPEKIEEFLFNLGEPGKQELMEDFLKVGLSMFLEQFAECFFVNNLEDIMMFRRDEFFFIGPKQEAFSTIFIASHFLAKAFAKSGFTFDESKFYDIIEFNPNVQRGTFYKIIGTFEEMKSVLTELNNGVEIGDKIQNRRIYDLFVMFIEGSISLNFECKNTRDIRRAERYIFKNMAVDTFSTIFPALFKQISPMNPIVEAQMESLIIAIESGDKESAEKIYHEMGALNTLADIADKNGNRKNPNHLEFYTTVADLINKKLDTEGPSLDTLAKIRHFIKNLFRDNTFKSEVREIANKIFGKVKVDEADVIDKHDITKIENSLISSAEIIFGTIGNLDRLMRRDESGQYRFFWDMSFQIYLPTNEEFSRTDLPAEVSFEVVEGVVMPLVRTRTPFEGPMMIVYHKDGRVGIAPADVLLNDLPRDVFIGYKKDEELIKNALITDSKGNRLIGKIMIENGEFKVLSKSEFNDLINENLLPYQLEVKGEIIDGFTLNYLRSAIWEAGSRITVFLQDMESYVVPTGEYKPMFENTRLQRMIEKRRYKLPNFKDFNSLSDLEKKKIEAIRDLFLQFMVVHKPKDLQSKPHEKYSISDLIFSDLLFQLSETLAPNGNPYSFNYLSEVFKILELTAAQLSQISWYTFNELTGERKDNIIKRKRFYNNFLEIFKSKFGDPAFVDLIGNLRDELKNEWTFILNNEFNAENLDSETYTATEFKLAKALDKILKKLLSYEGYTLLQMGIFSVSKRGDSYEIRPLAIHSETAREIMDKFGFRQISSIEEGAPKELKRLRFIINTLIPALVFGHIKDFKIEGKRELEQIHTFSENFLLSNLVRYQFNRPSIIKNFGRNYKDINGRLVRTYLSDLIALVKSEEGWITTFGSPTLIKRNIFGKQTIVHTFTNLIETQFTPHRILQFAIKNLYDPDVSPNMIKLCQLYSQDPITWSKKIQNYAIEQAWKFILNPQNPRMAYGDPILKLRHLILDPRHSTQFISLGAGTVSGQAKEFYNSEEAQFSVNFANIKHIIEKIQYSLNFYYRFKDRQYLSYLHILPELESKIIYTYTALYEILSEIPDGTILTSYIHKERANGFAKDTRLDKTLKSYISIFPELEISTFDIVKTQDSPEFRLFIAMITYHMVIFGATAFIKEGKLSDSTKGYLLFASLKELFDNDYIVGSVAESQKIKPRLNQEGQRLLNKYQSLWNKDPTGTEVWSYGDFIPAYSIIDEIERDLIIDKINKILGLTEDGLTIESYWS